LTHTGAIIATSFYFDERLRRAEISSDTMDMSSESSTARWYEPPRSSLEPPSGGAGVTGVVGNPSDYRGYYPHAGPTAHHPAAAAAHYAHSKCTVNACLVASPPFPPASGLAVLAEETEWKATATVSSALRAAR